MKKKNKNIIITILIVIAILGVLFYTGEIKLPFSTTGSYTCSGGQVLSISNAQIYTSSDLGGKKVIRVTFSTLPSSECLYINLNPTAINSKLSDSDKAQFQATNTVLGDIKLIKSQKVYNINERTGENFRNIGLDLLPDYNSLLKPCWDSNCRNSFSTTFASNMYSGNIWSGTADKCICSYDGSDLGINGEFSSSTGYKWETQINIGNENPLILTQNSLMGKIGSIAFVKWAGNLISNDNLEAISGYQAYKPYSDNQWRMIDYGTYTRFKDRYATLRQSLIDCDTLFGNCNYAVDTAYGYRTELNQNLQNKLSSWISGNNLVKTASISSNKLIVDLRSPIVYPTFTLDIDALAVGIFVSSGIPDVTCPSNIPKLVSGQTYDATINLKNIGSNSGSFTYSLTCNKGSQSLQPSPPQQISPGLTKNIVARLGLTVVEGTDTSSCTFTATDVESCRTTCKSDSCSFSYTAEHQSQCIAGTKTCELGNTELWTCRTDGTYDKIKCQYGCSFENGVYNCKAKPGGNETKPCESCWDWLKDKLGMETECSRSIFGKIWDALSCPFYFLKLTIVLIASLFALFFGQQFSEKTFKKIPVWATWILGILFAGLVGFLGYTFLTWYFVIPVLIVMVLGNLILNIIPGGKYIKRKWRE